VFWFSDDWLSHVDDRRRLFSVGDEGKNVKSVDDDEDGDGRKQEGEEAPFHPTVTFMGAWRRVATDSLEFHFGPPCPSFLCSAGGLPLKRPYGCLRGGLPAGSLRPFSTPLDTPRHMPMITLVQGQSIPDSL
jgi:hypothetical protein